MKCQLPGIESHGYVVGGPYGYSDTGFTMVLRRVESDPIHSTPIELLLFEVTYLSDSSLRFKVK